MLERQIGEALTSHDGPDSLERGMIDLDDPATRERTT